MFQSQQSPHSQNMSLINVFTVFLQPVREQIVCETCEEQPPWSHRGPVQFGSAQFSQLIPVVLNQRLIGMLLTLVVVLSAEKTEEFTESMRSFLHALKAWLAFSISFSI